MMKLKEIWLLVLSWFGLNFKPEPNVDNNVPDLSHCFTLMELFEYLYQTEDKPYIEKLIIVTVSGKLNVYFHQDKTFEDYMEFISSIKEPIELIMEYVDEHPSSSHWTYRRITDLYFYPSIHFKTSEVV